MSGAIFVLNRPDPLSRAIDQSIGFLKEYNADQQQEQEQEWAWAIDEAQREGQPQATENGDQGNEQMLEDFMKRHPPPPYTPQKPAGRLSMPVILPQWRPRSNTRGWVRGYAPVLMDVDVKQDAWFEFLDSFDKAINKNGVFWAANAAVWLCDKAYLIAAGPAVAIWAEIIVYATHASIETGRRAYIHNQYNTYLDAMNEKFMKPRGLYCLVMRYQPDDMNVLGGLVDIRENLTETVTRREDPERPGYKKYTSIAADKTKNDVDMPDFAPLIFPKLDDADASVKESAWKHFVKFYGEYKDRNAVAEFEAKNPDSRLAGVVPQKEYVSRYSNPQHPARAGGMINVLSGGRYNPKGPLLILREAHKARRTGKIHNADADADAGGSGSALFPDGKIANDKNAVAWQEQQKRRRGGLRGMLRGDVMYLMVVNMPSPEEMELAKQRIDIKKAASAKDERAHV